MRLGLTLIYVEDFAPMFTFYRDVIGLETTRADPGEGYEVGADWAQFTDGHGGEIELFDHGRFGTGFEFPLPRANAAVITFRVDDLEAELSRLRGRGVQFFSEGWYDWGGAAHFLDPEGNHLQLFQVGR